MKGTQFTNTEIARLFRKVAAAYTISGENRFKVIAYDNAATAVEHATSELKDLWEEGELESVPGLGSSIIGHLDELFRNGSSKHFEAVLAKVNPAVFPLLEVPGIGPKKAGKLVEILHLSSAATAIADLKKAAKDGRIAEIESFGEKSEQDILANIERHSKGAIKEKRMVLPLASRIADEITEYMQKKLGSKIVKIDRLGSLRRQVATIGDLDFAVATNHFEDVIDAFVSFPGTASLIERGPTGASILLGLGRQADLRVSKPKDYGAMLQYFTGSKYHNILLREYALKKGLSLNEYGIKNLKVKNGQPKPFETEEELYNFLGLDYIAPELREDSGELEAAKNHTLPKLVELKDIKGDLQVHSSFDLETSHDAGKDSMPDIRLMAKRLGYDYVGITNHNPSSKHTTEQIVAKLRSQNEYIEHLNSSTKGTRVIGLLEVDISPDGTLPVPQEGLDYLDGCLVSIHSSFQMDKEAMTKRVLLGLSNPVAKILAHPTGRLLTEREGFELDWDKVFSFCIANDKAVEINCYPNRLDLPDTLVREAVKRGVLLSLGTDSHAAVDMDNMRFGVSVARRGWAEAKNIINSWEYNRLIKWMRTRKVVN